MRRARETWDLVRPHLGDVSERSEPRLYEVAPDQLLAIVRETGREIGTLLIIGHNPGLEDLARRLVRSGKRDARARLKQKYPTAALAVIDCTIENWRETAPRSGRLARFITPRSLEFQDHRARDIRQSDGSASQ